MIEFLRSATSRPGFHRNPESARAETAVIKENAANGPARPRISVDVARERADQELRRVRNLTQHAL
ncbi:MAG: hypothetical protein EOO52_13655 [Gammaproteobacteria bacterium]|nr:MAG: hypothetical protein EOO52_13655 [Gammaproteobacteria bacterium]